jgi:hypothetical protein
MDVYTMNKLADSLASLYDSSTWDDSWSAIVTALEGSVVAAQDRNRVLAAVLARVQG